MKSVHRLLSSGRVLGVFLLLSMCVTGDMAAQEKPTTPASMSDLITNGNVSEATNLTATTTVSQDPTRDYSFISHDGKTTGRPITGRTSSKASTTSTTATTTNAPTGFLTNKACTPVLMVSGGLILACFIFLMSMLLLACKVCQLNRRIKTLRRNDELISNSDFWMGTAKKNKSKSETEAKETTVLLTGLQQTQEEEKNGAVKEDGEKINKDGQMEDEKKVGDASPSNEASEEIVTAAKSSSSKMEEKVADSKSTSVEAASPSEGAEQTQGGP